MAGLVTAIPISSLTNCPPKRDARDKRGHDDNPYYTGSMVSAGSFGASTMTPVYSG